MDNDNNLLWEVKNRLLWKDRDNIYNATATTRYEEAKQDFLTNS